MHVARARSALALRSSDGRHGDAGECVFLWLRRALRLDLFCLTGTRRQSPRGPGPIRLRRNRPCLARRGLWPTLSHRILCWFSVLAAEAAHQFHGAGHFFGRAVHFGVGGDEIEQLGGQVVVPKMAVPGFGYFAVCLDTENNTFAIWENDVEAS